MAISNNDSLDVKSNQCHKPKGRKFWQHHSIYYKRLERGQFKFPKLNKASVTLGQQELELLLDGIDISKLKRLPELRYQAVL
ncbi:IS66 family insertion sequence element accessory protein TnpB [Kaarinaea lacus]